MDLNLLKEKAKKAIESAPSRKEIDVIFRTYLGRKGELTTILRSLGTRSGEERRRLGQEANELRTWFEERCEARKREIQRAETERGGKEEWIDVTAPGKRIAVGHLHPLTQVQRTAREIFQSMGFEVAEGPEIESEWYNFDALNIPPNHPARDMWDTFWLKGNQKIPKEDGKVERLLLRTHTSPVQIRYMEKHSPPLRIIAPGRIFRYEATDARHEINFYQLEGLMVGKTVSAGNFKAIIQEFFGRFFGTLVKIRLRPSYFPFTEPSFEVDMTCLLCSGKGCSGCGNAGWIEIMGAGMVHQNVFGAVGYVPGEWQGFAFGMGLDRLAMMKYKINDIRLLYNGDLRFLHQF
ncbi:MAG: phenylalanine--tRNA ligase subunit alpha [Patescibacteria group bacterium]